MSEHETQVVMLEFESWHELECGCAFGMRGLKGDIRHCPRHKAADAMYGALKNLVNEIAVMGDVGWYNEDGGFIRKAQAALALADGDV